MSIDLSGLNAGDLAILSQAAERMRQKSLSPAEQELCKPLGDIYDRWLELYKPVSTDYVLTVGKVNVAKDTIGFRVVPEGCQDITALIWRLSDITRLCAVDVDYPLNHILDNWDDEWLQAEYGGLLPAWKSLHDDIREWRRLVESQGCSPVEIYEKYSRSRA